MILGFDSSYTLPDDAGLRQAKADGVGAWAGYMTTKPSGIATWPKSNFDRIKVAGLATWAYVSGWDDPLALKAQAAAWDVRIILDVENGIRGDGPWVQGFLDTSGSGLYGSPSIFLGRQAVCYVAASYPGGASPKATWPYTPPPNGPHGWQSQGTHSAYGASVDSGYYDDWFASATPQGEDLTPEQDATLTRVDAALQFIINDPKLGLPPIAAVQQFAINDPNVGLVAIKAEIAELARQVATITQGQAKGNVTISGTFPVTP